MITSEQIRAARALLRIEQDDLARKTQLSVTTIRRVETIDGLGRVAEATVREIQKALEKAGAEFITGGVKRREQDRHDVAARYRELRAIAEQSARELAGLPSITDADLYDEHGLPK